MISKKSRNKQEKLLEIAEGLKRRARAIEKVVLNSVTYEVSDLAKRSDPFVRLVISNEKCRLSKSKNPDYYRRLVFNNERIFGSKDGRNNHDYLTHDALFGEYKDMYNLLCVNRFAEKGDPLMKKIAGQRDALIDKRIVSYNALEESITPLVIKYITRTLSSEEYHGLLEGRLPFVNNREGNPVYLF